MQQDRQLSADLSARWDPTQGLTGCSGGLCSRISPWGHRRSVHPKGPSGMFKCADREAGQAFLASSAAQCASHGNH